MITITITKKQIVTFAIIVLLVIVGSASYRVGYSSANEDNKEVIDELNERLDFIEDSLSRGKLQLCMLKSYRACK